MTSPTEPLIRRNMPELDTIRGLAILGVMLYHGLYWQLDLSMFSPLQRLFLTAMWTGRLGVNLFFVLSGFLITGVLLVSRDSPLYYRNFYIRRTLRILPAYLLTIFILGVTGNTSLSFALLSLVYLSNVTPLLGVGISYPVFWSLAVEEHFYFLWPWIVRKLSSQRLLALCIFVICASPIARFVSYLWAYHLANGGHVSFQSNDYTWNSLDGLACGAALAILLREIHLTRAQLLKLTFVLLSAAAAIWIVGFPFGILKRQSPLGFALQVVPWHFVFTALLAAFLLIGSGPWKSLVQLRALRFLGTISYGLYLYHLLVFQLVDFVIARHGFIPFAGSPFQWLIARFIIASSVSILIAWLSRTYFEERFLRWKDRLTGA